MVQILVKSMSSSFFFVKNFRQAFGRYPLPMWIVDLFSIKFAIFFSSVITLKENRCPANVNTCTYELFGQLVRVNSEHVQLPYRVLHMNVKRETTPLKKPGIVSGLSGFG